ncbi:TetR/AcrR family transcriptional regulator [Nocardia pseudovaccinii]|uniref:TetR/AcrR family transcriptional regulator n=1 Tax=Nocardia pseudovaccinii TaxID=189540 RepID=UPI0007C7AD5C|nr:TetR/AcrR family transcriptional regulator [Nocardia pseudovaccinii]
MQIQRSVDPSTRQGRRVLETRRRFMRALAELCLEIDYGAVTIDAIAARADLGRATFWKHFRDKDDLLFQMSTVLRQDLDARVAAVPTDNVGFTGELTTAAFEHAAAEPQMYRVVLRGTGDGVPLLALLDEVARTAEQIFGSRAKRLDAQARIPLEVVSRAWAGQTATLMLWWLETGMPHPPAEMARMANELALHGHLWAQGFAERYLSDGPQM